MASNWRSPAWAESEREQAEKDTPITWAYVRGVLMSITGTIIFLGAHRSTAHIRMRDIVRLTGFSMACFRGTTHGWQWCRRCCWAWRAPCYGPT